MSLADVAKQGPSQAEKGPTCSVCQLMTSLPKAEAIALTTMLSEPTWRYSAISEALYAEGHKILDMTLSRHARGQCSARNKLR